MSLLNILSLVTSGLRALAAVAPVLVESGKADKITSIITDIADLADRGGEAFEEVKADLEQLVADLKAMDGVSSEAREELLSEILNRSERIQAAAEALRAQQGSGGS